MKPMNVKVSDLSDDDLNAIVRLRKEIPKPEEREGFARGLYYIALADNSYSEAERALVEGTACALGINEKKMADIADDLDNNPNAIQTFATVGPKAYRERLFQEMGALTYLKGYQLDIEDKDLKKTAKAMGIPADKAEKDLLALYMRSQGIPESSTLKSTGAKVALGAGAIVAGAAICALTAGAAAPVIGAAIGGSMGLSGAAASSAGLALLGGGGMAAGAATVVAAGAVLGGGGTAMAVSVKSNIDSAYDAEKLKAVIKKQRKDQMTKQEIVSNLVKAIEVQKTRLDKLEKNGACERDIAGTTRTLTNLQAEKLALETAED
jgi:DnaJ-domain-containing protein 1